MKIIRGLQRLWRDESGSIMLESAVVFPVQMFLTLSIVQIAFVLAALNVVNYAAFQAARTAAVTMHSGVIDDDGRRRARHAAMIVVGSLHNRADAANAGDGKTAVLRTMHHLYYLEELQDWQLQVTVGHTAYKEGEQVVAAGVCYFFPLTIPLVGGVIGGVFSGAVDKGLMHIPIARTSVVPKPWL